MKKEELKEDFKVDNYDQLGFLLFNKALHKIFHVNEGLVIEHDIEGKKEKFIVGKWVENDEEVVGIEFDIQDNFKDGMIVDLIQQED